MWGGGVGGGGGRGPGGANCEVTVAESISLSIVAPVTWSQGVGGVVIHVAGVK